MAFRAPERGALEGGGQVFAGERDFEFVGVGLAGKRSTEGH